MATTTSLHTEKATHAITKLAAAAATSNTNTSSSHHSSSSNTKWIILGAVLGSILVLTFISLIGFVFYRRYKKRKAYNMVSRGVDMAGTPAWKVTGPNGEARDGESDNTSAGGVKPLFLNRGNSTGMAAARERGREPFRAKGQRRGSSIDGSGNVDDGPGYRDGGLASHPTGRGSGAGRARSQSATPSMSGRRSNRASVSMGMSGDSVFDADKEIELDGDLAGERLIQGSGKIGGSDGFEDAMGGRGGRYADGYQGAGYADVEGQGGSYEGSGYGNGGMGRGKLGA